MTRAVVSVGADKGQQDRAHGIQRHDLPALPVVDREQPMVRIPVAAGMEAIEQEVTRDLLAAGALQGGDGDEALQGDLVTGARRRSVGLLVLCLANGGTAVVNASQEAVLRKLVVLAA